MIPIKLELQGLYSYKEKQTVDFTQLTAAGLFGIFGAVGSGKSSILEAIMLALYGNTERLAARGEKTSMVNLQSEILSISFEFSAGKNNSETYKATYGSRRNKKNFDDIRPADHHFYHKTPEGWMPVSPKSDRKESDIGAELIGMKMEHFRQTVIIPQGKFRDFIEQKPMARAEMMKELFGLERFDLSAKTGHLLKKNNEEKIRLQTRLQPLEDINPETQKQKETDLNDLSVQKSVQEELLKVQEATFNHLKSVQEKYSLLTNLEDRNRQLMAEKPAIDEKKEELGRYRKAVAFLQPIVAQLKEKEIEAEKYEVSFLECARWKTDYEEKVAKLEAEEQKLKIDQNKKGEREAKIRDLQKIIIINGLEKDLAQNQVAVDQLLPKSEKEKKDLVALQQRIYELETKEDQAKVPDARTLADLKNILRELDQLERVQKDLAGEINALKKQKSIIEGKIGDYQKMLPHTIGDFEQWSAQQTGFLDEQLQQREILIRQQGLSAYSLNLSEGESCPLCGSTAHPQPLSHDFDDDLLEQNSKRIQQHRAELETIRKHQASLEREYLQLEASDRNLDQKVLELAKSEAEEGSVKGKLKLLEIDSKVNLLSRLAAYEKAFEEQELLVAQLKKLRRDYQKQKEQFDQDEERLRAAEQKLLTFHATLSAQKGEIKHADFSFKYLGVSREQITRDIEMVQKAIDDLEINLKRNQDRLKEARQGQATNLANLRNFEKLLAETREKYAILQNELAQQLIEQGFSDQQEVTDLLGSSLNPDRWEQDIKAYENQVEVVKERLKELNENKEVREFKEEIFQELSAKLNAVKSALEQLNARHTLLHQEIEDIKLKLQQKMALGKALEQVEKRGMNLRELEKLFKGNGFVKFVSSIYLKELCHTANQRFLKLTKNSLSLEIDEDNNFWVRDYLNGGKKRLLKSLSGGQTFQASLCLALALAEKVKSLNRADQSFFFLDEGFGALDRASLRTVFEALKSLRHENRIVGIISHVEELQQEIEVYAKVELDSDQGSVVSYSF